ncbi:hypothetical protein [Rhizobium mesoamericanum]|uniref:hypothetical protein n=1 Tax=Rhizobium mesoamericanum TaxID=1079800 RepID=UPI00041E74F4|nr:hypothetical protein [Rhizobium mesoamericanum]
MSEQSELETSIHRYLAKRSGVSLVELARDIPGFNGDEVWGNLDNKVAIWINMSKSAIAAMTSLIAADKIEATPTNALVYAFDGGMLDMPIAKTIKRKYAKAHWFPVVFAGVRGVA